MDFLIGTADCGDTGFLEGLSELDMDSARTPGAATAGVTSVRV